MRPRSTHPRLVSPFIVENQTIKIQYQLGLITSLQVRWITRCAVESEWVVGWVSNPLQARKWECSRGGRQRQGLSLFACFWQGRLNSLVKAPPDHLPLQLEQNSWSLKNSMHEHVTRTVWLISFYLGPLSESESMPINKWPWPTRYWFIFFICKMSHTWHFFWSQKTHLRDFIKMFMLQVI